MASNTPRGNGKEPEDEKKTNSFKESWESFKPKERFDNLYSFARTNTADTIAYVILFIGLILWIFQYFFGGLLIGIVGGFYFGDTLIAWARNLREYVETESVIRSLILIGIILGLVIGAPSIFIGAVAAIGIRYIVVNATM
jgi:hypothetical protein